MSPREEAGETSLALEPRRGAQSKGLKDTGVMGIDKMVEKASDAQL